MSSATLYREDRYGKAPSAPPIARRAGRQTPYSGGTANTAAPKLSRKDQAFIDRIAARQHTTEDDIYEDESRPVRRSSNRQRNTTDNLRYADDYRPRRTGMHPLFYMGIGVLVIIILWTSLWAAISWATIHISDPAAYPHGISYLFDTFGHNNDNPQHPSMIEAFNYRGQAEVIEWPAGDPTKAKIYPGPKITDIFGFTGNPYTAVISTQAIDINQDGKKDLLVNICGDVFAANLQRMCDNYKMLNTGSGFKAA